MAYRGNKSLNCEIERIIKLWDGTIHGFQIKNAYENGVPYESVCELAGIDYEEYCEEE